MFCLFSICHVVDQWLKIGVDSIYFHTDIGTQQSLMIHPDQFRHYLKPLFNPRLLAEALAGLAPQDVPTGPAAFLVGLLDRDGDGKVEIEDLKAWFDAADANHDGKVDATEIVPTALPGRPGGHGGPGRPGHGAPGGRDLLQEQLRHIEALRRQGAGARVAVLTHAPDLLPIRESTS